PLRRLCLCHVHVQEHRRSRSRSTERGIGVDSPVSQTTRPSRSDRGQALGEFALITPVLIFFVLLTVDVSRAFWESIDAAGAARAGARMGVISDTSDIGEATRDEPNTGIPNTAAAWGAVGPGTAQGTCTTAAQVCGDPNACPASSFSGTQIACFAI